MKAAEITYLLNLKGSVIKRIRKNKLALTAFYIFSFLITTAIFAPIIANEKPLYMRYAGENYFPAFWDLNPFTDNNFYEIKNKNGASEKLQLDITDWKHFSSEKTVWCLVAYSPGKSDYANANFVSPFGKQNFIQNNKVIETPVRFRHFLGTGVRGEDVLAGLIFGTRLSLTIGIFSMLIASVVGLLLGSLAGYFGDFQFQSSRIVLIFICIGILFAFFYSFTVRNFELKDALSNSPTKFTIQILISIAYFISILILFFLCGKVIEKIGIGKTKTFLPIDSIVSRVMEVIVSLPVFVLILSIAAIARPSILNLIFIIGLTSWTTIARLTRAELMRIKKLDYIRAAKALGYSEVRIIIKHALINGIAPVLVAVAFGVASAILIESSLSFLGVGLPVDAVTWGSMLNEGRTEFSAWWMILFPGMAIFITVTVCNLLGESLRELLDVRMK